MVLINELIPHMSRRAIYVSELGGSVVSESSIKRPFNCGRRRLQCILLCLLFFLNSAQHTYRPLPNSAFKHSLLFWKFTGWKRDVSLKYWVKWVLHLAAPSQHFIINHLIPSPLYSLRILSNSFSSSVFDYSGFSSSMLAGSGPVS